MSNPGFAGGLAMGGPAKTVFLSHASQDAAAARRICDALRAAGLEVWFDESELRGGDAWDAAIRRQISECALFVPVISANACERAEGYFRLEWKLAVDRSHRLADDQAFLLPVVIDGTPEASARVPDRFRERHWSRLEGGETPPEFVEHVKSLLFGIPAPAPAGPPMRAVRSHATKHRRRKILTSAAIPLVAIAVAVAVWSVRSPSPAPVTPAAALTSAPDRKSIAVLPFDNLSGREEDAYLVDGLQEEILNALARLRDLRVISRTSVMAYRGQAHDVREIGRRLGVGTLLEGSIRRQGSTLRLTVQLVDAKDDRHVLAANYDRELSNVLDLQSTVARLVAEALAATLTRSERDGMDRVTTNSGDAYDRYLRAVALFRKPAPNDDFGVVESARLLGEALRFDPDYSDALALLSQAHTWLYFKGKGPKDGAAAKQAYERALAIDPQLPEAKLARGLYAMYVSDNLDQALADLGAVLESRPNLAEANENLGFALRRRGRMEEAFGHFVRASDLDPLNINYSIPGVQTMLALRRYAEAIEQTRILTKRLPNEPYSYLARARIEARYVKKSNGPLRDVLRDHGKLLWPEQHKAVEAEIATGEGRYLEAIGLLGSVPDRDALKRREVIGSLYLLAGDATRAEATFREAERYWLEMRDREPGRAESVGNLSSIAMIQSMQGKHEAALASIEKARKLAPESRDAANGPQVSFCRSVILVRAGRREEGYAEVARLLRVPFGAPTFQFLSAYHDPMMLLLKDDPRFDELINRPPRL